MTVAQHPRARLPRVLVIQLVASVALEVLQEGERIARRIRRKGRPSDRIVSKGQLAARAAFLLDEVQLFAVAKARADQHRALRRETAGACRARLQIVRQAGGFPRRSRWNSPDQSSRPSSGC